MTTPTTVEELKTARAAAGERYAAAIAELQASLIELAAYDVALMNNNVSHNHVGLYGTFHGIADNVPNSLRHPEFGTYEPDWRGQVKTLADQVIRNVAG
ncbi:hypothetical protein [Sinorhizobium fredii]|uniref:hypothetical protein n=1 Tax=Rhizobium fredii TaxID=380 RepID=UPI003511885F